MNFQQILLTTLPALQIFRFGMKLYKSVLCNNIKLQPI